MDLYGKSIASLFNQSIILRLIFRINFFINSNCIHDFIVYLINLTEKMYTYGTSN